MKKLEVMIHQFKEVDFSYRLELLLEYADNLSELPEEYKIARDAGMNRIHECQTPVFIWTKIEDGKIKLYADVSPEVPTVRGFVSLLVNTLTDMTPKEFEAVPNDLLNLLGLSHHLGMVRLQELTAIVPRIKDEVKKALSVS